MSIINEYEKQYEVIITMPDGHHRDKALANLMTELEVHFQIPMLKNKEREIENPEVFELYQKVSLARSF